MNERPVIAIGHGGPCSGELELCLRHAEIDMLHVGRPQRAVVLLLYGLRGNHRLGNITYEMLQTKPGGRRGFTETVAGVRARLHRRRKPVGAREMTSGRLSARNEGFRLRSRHRETTCLIF